MCVHVGYLSPGLYRCCLVAVSQPRHVHDVHACTLLTIVSLECLGPVLLKHTQITVYICCTIPVTLLSLCSNYLYPAPPSSGPHEVSHFTSPALTDKLSIIEHLTYRYSLQRGTHYCRLCYCQTHDWPV